MMLKKLLIAAGIIAITAAPAYAANGDIKSTIYSTDILTLVDGKPIESYNIGGQTMIALEDLEDYGFSVYYSNEERLLIVNKIGEPDADFNPQIARGKPGRKTGYTYETDIAAFVNGELIDAESINGKLLAVVEALGYAGKFEEYGLKHTQNGMGYSYDDSTRTLSLETTNPTSYENQISALTAYESEHGNFSHKIVKCSGFDAIILNGVDDDAVSNHLFLIYPSGRIINMDNILTNDNGYGFGAFPHSKVFNGRLSDDKKQFLFTGERYRATGLRSSELIDSGSYALTIPSGRLIKLN